MATATVIRFREAKYLQKTYSAKYLQQSYSGKYLQNSYSVKLPNVYFTVTLGIGTMIIEVNFTVG